MFLSFLGRDKLLDLVREEHHADLIVVLYRRESQGSGDLGDHLLLHDVDGAKVTATGHVDQQHHRQLTLLLEHLDIRADVAGGHVPVDIPDIIAVLIFPHLAERHTTALESRMVLAGEDVTGKTTGLYLDTAYLL